MEQKSIFSLETKLNYFKMFFIYLINSWFYHQMIDMRRMNCDMGRFIETTSNVEIQLNWMAAYVGMIVARAKCILYFCCSIQVELQLSDWWCLFDEIEKVLLSLYFVHKKKNTHTHNNFFSVRVPLHFSCARLPFSNAQKLKIANDKLIFSILCLHEFTLFNRDL